MLHEEHSNFSCPYCASPNSVYIDISAGNSQEWVSDCEICCRPIVVSLELQDGELIRLDARQENE